MEPRVANRLDDAEKYGMGLTGALFGRPDGGSQGFEVVFAEIGLSVREGEVIRIPHNFINLCPLPDSHTVFPYEHLSQLA